MYSKKVSSFYYRMSHFLFYFLVSSETRFNTSRVSVCFANFFLIIYIFSLFCVYYVKLCVKFVCFFLFKLKKKNEISTNCSTIEMIRYLIASVNYIKIYKIYYNIYISINKYLIIIYRNTRADSEKL